VLLIHRYPDLHDHILDLVGSDGAADRDRKIDMIGIVRSCTDLTRSLRDKGLEMRFLTNLSLPL